MSQSILFTEDIDSNTAEYRFCYERCQHCFSIFTVTILKGGIPLATKCLMGHSILGDSTVHLWGEGEIEKFKQTGKLP